MPCIQDMLIAWGRGQQINRAPNGYPPQAPGAHLIRNPGQASVRIPPLAEDDRERVEAAVQQLRAHKYEHYHVIYLHYVLGKNDKAVSQTKRISRSSARSLRQNAEHYLEALIDNVNSG